QLRQPKDSHDGVTDELLNRAAVPFQNGLHLGEVAVQDLPQGLGVKLFSQSRRPHQVTEDNRDGLTDLLGQRRLRKLHPADPTQPKAVWVLLTAVRADLHRTSVAAGYRP